MLIIEGADLVGKTTFCKALLKDERLAQLGYMYHHLTRPPVHGFDGCMAYMEMSWTNYVQDRFHLSAPIYSMVRGETIANTTPEQYRLVDAHLRLMGALMVVITADDELVASRFESRKSQEMYDLRGILKANRIYTCAAKNGYIESALGLYKPDIDVVINCTIADPFPTSDTVDTVVRTYFERQSHVEKALD